jgi:D-glycero-alpha-D-manno-heptose-7-phosphate kinase
MSTHAIASAAHRIETELLHQQSGIQDQLCAAYGGINLIEMDAYPHASVASVQVAPAIARELERRVVLIYLGRSHQSSQIHETVIASLAQAGPDCKQLNDLRRMAERSRDAVLAGDLRGLGSAMIDNTDAQGRLHASLISADAQRVIDIARAHDAVGWKVNGAGGEGGSITLLGNEVARVTREMVRQIEAANPLFKNIPISLSRAGVTVWRVNDDRVQDPASF